MAHAPGFGQPVAVAHELSTNKVRRNMPDPVPVIGRLAVDRGAPGRKLGAALLQDAVKRAVAVSNNAGVRALLVHALHERAQRFYEHYGFQPSPTHSLTLMLRLSASQAAHPDPAAASTTTPPARRTSTAAAP